MNIKRFTDITLSLVLLILLFPIIIIVSLIIKVTSKGSIFFKQRRLGKNMVTFVIYKFRTMVSGAEAQKQELTHCNEADGPVFKIYDDPRLTRFGKFLAHTGFDEVPQLINVLRGEMSLVGPRPLPVNEARKVPIKYKARFSALPGMTSTWIVKGSHKLSFDQWMKLDVDYVKKSSILLDLNIILDTFMLILRWILGQNINRR